MACDEVEGGREKGHDIQERLLMDSCDSCDLLLEKRQVPPLRKKDSRRGKETC